MTFLTDIVLPGYLNNSRRWEPGCESFQGIGLPMRTFTLQAEMHTEVWRLKERMVGSTGNEMSWRFRTRSQGAEDQMVKEQSSFEI